MGVEITFTDRTTKIFENATDWAWHDGRINILKPLVDGEKSTEGFICYNANEIFSIEEIDLKE